MNLKNSNCDETQKNLILMKLKNSNFDETQNSDYDEFKKLN